MWSLHILVEIQRSLHILVEISSKSVHFFMLSSNLGVMHPFFDAGSYVGVMYAFFDSGSNLGVMYANSEELCMHFYKSGSYVWFFINPGVYIKDCCHVIGILV
jgi:hypothetical protein